MLDLGGGALAPLAALPNVATYVDGQDVDGVRRVLAELERLVEDRPRRFRRHGAGGVSAWRELVAAGAAEGPAHTVLLLDHLASFRERFADLDPVLGRLVAEGPSAGVHVAMTSTRWAELPPKRLDHVSTRVELRLNDPLECQHGRVRAGCVPAGAPGRGLVGDGVVVQVAHLGTPAVPAPRAAPVWLRACIALLRTPGTGGRASPQHPCDGWPT